MFYVSGSFTKRFFTTRFPCCFYSLSFDFNEAYSIYHYKTKYQSPFDILTLNYYTILNSFGLNKDSGKMISLLFLQWWEVGKAQIRVLCQNYTSKCLFCTQIDRTVTFYSIKVELNSILQERTLVQAHFTKLQDMVAPTTF